MDIIVIKGGRQLNGTVATSGAKNAALPLLFSSLLAQGEHVFDNVPRLNDIDSTELLLNHLNCETQRNGHQLKVNVNRPQSLVAPYDIVRKMRARILCLGPLIARYG
ncbi:MAG: UDP-N-acetylglucosamine 1-carboxyvinyltransferase, partial [Gammaproteobacteria bacterium]|nr:UDP-N-acetylglucosamine 1-carboxyvinyltransferase [Gammaproteobacteria bacterium]